MSSVTVITDSNGEIMAIGHGHLSEETGRRAKFKQRQGGLRAGPGQRLHEIDVPEDLELIENWRELHSKVAPHIRG